MYVISDVMVNIVFKISCCRNDWMAGFMNGSGLNPMANGL